MLNDRALGVPGGQIRRPHGQDNVLTVGGRASKPSLSRTSSDQRAGHLITAGRALPEVLHQYPRPARAGFFKGARRLSWSRLAVKRSDALGALGTYPGRFLFSRRPPLCSPYDCFARDLCQGFGLPNPPNACQRLGADLRSLRELRPPDDRQGLQPPHLG